MEIRMLYCNSVCGKTAFTEPRGVNRCHKLHIVRNGSFRCTMEGVTFTVTPGQAVWFPFGVAFEREVLSPLSYHELGFLASGTDTDMVPQMTPGVLSVPERQVRTLIDTLDASLSSPVAGEPDFYGFAVQYLLAEQQVRHASADAVQDADVAAALAWFRGHLAEKISIPDLAASLHLSHNGLIWKFRHTLGAPPVAILTEMRLSRAARLLCDSTLRVGEIATLTGYRDAYYFSAAFHRRFSVSPAAYRAAATVTDT